MKRMLSILMIALLLMSGAALAEEQPLREIDVVLDWYPNALHAFLYTAIDNGYYAEEGLQVNVRFPSNANDAIALVAAGRADVGLYYQQDVIQVRANQNVPIKSIGAVVQSPLSIVLSLTEKNIASPSDLAGKTVGHAGTELSEALIRSIMEYDGVDANQVQLIDVGFDLMTSMTTGNVDATIGCLINHEVPQLIEKGFDISWLELTDYGVPNYYEGVFLASDDTIANEPEMLSAFLRASEKGFEDVCSDPDEAIRTLLANQSAENFPLSEGVERESLAVLLPLMQPEGSAFLTQSDECWQENIDWLLEQGLIRREVSVDDVRANLER